jgi:hypothetical protein
MNMNEITGALGVLTGFVSSVMTLGIVFWVIYWRYRQTQLQYHERQLMIERGMTPPPNLPNGRSMSPQDCLRRGVVMLFVGVGLAVAGTVAGRSVEEEVGGFLGVAAAIVAFVGLGNLVYYFIARRTEPALRGGTEIHL